MILLDMGVYGHFESYSSVTSTETWSGFISRTKTGFAVGLYFVSYYFWCLKIYIFFIFFVSLPLRQSWKLFLKLCLRGWLRSRRNPVVSLIPLRLWQSKILLGLVRINFQTLLLKILMFSEFLIFWSRLFNSWIVEEKNKFLKNSCFILNWGIVSGFCVIYRRLYG